MVLIYNINTQGVDEYPISFWQIGIVSSALFLYYAPMGYQKQYCVAIIFLITNLHSTEENKEGLWKHIALNADPRKKSKMLRQ